MAGGRPLTGCRGGIAALALAFTLGPCSESRTRVPHACLPHLVLGLCKLSSACPGPVVCFEHLPLSQPHPFPIYTFCLQLTALGLGIRNASTPRISQALPTPAISRSWPYPVNLRVQLCDQMTRTELPRLLLQGQRFPIAADCDLILVQQRSNFISAR